MREREPFNPTLWTNSSKVAAIGGTILVSYLGMRMWVFVQSAQINYRLTTTAIKQK
jgi:putative flippase GtrA